MKLGSILKAFMLMGAITAHAEMGCPPAVPTPGQYGPFNYDDPEARAKKLPIVEQYHFQPEVELLIKGESGVYVGGDLDYVLRAFPNHARALNAMARLAKKEKTNQPRGARFTVECYFKRATGFAPEDPMPYMLYGNYLFSESKPDEALEKYKQAEKLDPNNANILYNAGLLYFDMKQYDEALSYAKKAYSLGFPLPGLRNKLEKIGKWVPDSEQNSSR